MLLRIEKETISDKLNWVYLYILCDLTVSIGHFDVILGKPLKMSVGMLPFCKTDYVFVILAKPWPHWCNLNLKRLLFDLNL